MNQPPKKVNVKIDEKVGEGIYSNMTGISFSASEFIMDFGRMLPGLPSARILSRVIATPQSAKQLLMALEKNIEKYENQYGEIAIPGKDEGRDIGFKTA